MKKKILSVLLFSALVLCVNSQVSMVPQLPAVGIVQKNQLWNFLLVYAGNSSIDVTIGVTILNAADNRPLATAQSKPVTLIKGAKQIKSSDVAPVQYNYMSSVFDVDRDPNGFLPIGNYRVCYTVYSIGAGGEPLAEDCIPVEVQPLSPVQLNIPADSALLESIYPQFTWLPPMPMSLYSDLNYDVVIVEVMSGQTALAAIQQNLPVYNIGNCKTNYLNFPSSFKSLETGKMYAWRVIAKNATSFTSQSEVWTFKIANNNTDIPVPFNNYIVLNGNTALSSTLLLNDNYLGIKYYSFDKASVKTIQFKDPNGKIVKTYYRNIVYGDNFLKFDLGNAFASNKLYNVVIIDDNNTAYKATFRTQSTTTN